MQKTFWPNNPLYITLCVVLAFLVPWVPLYELKFDSNAIIAFFLFLIAVFVIFFYFMRVVIDDRSVQGPVLSIWPGKIPRKEVECYFNEKILGARHVVIRHKFSGRQIQLPALLFTSRSLGEMESVLREGAVSDRIRSHDDLQ